MFSDKVIVCHTSEGTAVAAVVASIRNDWRGHVDQ